MFNVGQFSQYDDANSKMNPQVLIAAMAVALAVNKGAFYQECGSPLAPIMNIDFDIFHRSKTTRAGEVGAGGWTDGVTTTALPIDSTSAKGLTVGHVLKVESETVVVKSVNRTANTVDVWARGAAGTTGAAHVATTAFAVIGHAGHDADLKNVESITEGTGKYANFCQTIFETLDWQFQAVNLKKRGLKDGQIYPILMNEAMFRVAEILAVMAVLGEKQEGTAAGTPYMTAGLIAQLLDTAGGSRTVYEYAVGGAFTEVKLKAALKEIFAVGSPDTIWCSATNKEIINGFNASAINVNTTRTDSTAGYHVDKYDYEGKILEVRVDADIPDSKIPIVNQSKCTKGWLTGDGLRTSAEPGASSREKRESIQGSIGMAVEDVGSEHTIMTGIV